MRTIKLSSTSPYCCLDQAVIRRTISVTKQQPQQDMKCESSDFRTAVILWLAPMSANDSCGRLAVIAIGYVCLACGIKTTWTRITIRRF